MKKSIMVLMVLFSMPVQAGTYWDGYDLLSKCESRPASACLGYIMGVAEAHDTIMVWETNKPYICASDSVTAGQLERVVSRYLNAHPAELRFTAASTVMNALAEAFPCK